MFDGFATICLCLCSVFLRTSFVRLCLALFPANLLKTLEATYLYFRSLESYTIGMVIKLMAVFSETVKLGQRRNKGLGIVGQSLVI